MPRNERPTSPQASVSGRVPTQLKNKSNNVDELVELRRRYENSFAEAPWPAGERTLESER